jgi:hypothetical protein
MALRLVIAWIGLNVGALLLLGVVDILRLTTKRVVRMFTRPQVAEHQPS